MPELQTSDSIGFVYYAVGDAYRHQASVSLNSLRQHMPDVPVQVHTDRPDQFQDQATSVVEEAATYGKAHRIRILQQTPFEHTVFIDSDTFVASACLDVFALLKAKELALAPIPHKLETAYDGIPDAFPGFNSGIFAYRRTAGLLAVLATWEQRFIELRATQSEMRDEVSLRRTLYENSLNMAPLPCRYNFRIAQPQLVYNPAEVAILHGHTDNFQPVIDQLRSGANPLLYAPPQ